MEGPKQYKTRFLAAMTRSDVVTQFVCVSVCVSLFFLLVSLFSFSVIEVSSSPEEFQWYFKAV